MRWCFENRLKDLKRLPALEPPAHLEASTLEGMAKASAPHRMYPLALAAGWFAAIGIGALLAVPTLSPEPPEETEPRSTAADTAIESAVDTAADSAAEEAYVAFLEQSLLEQSVYLEQLLAELPQRQAMRVSTAGTIVGLEERIELIDAALSREEPEAASPAYRLALMRDRVDTMGALVSVRYTQSPTFAY